MAEPVDYDALKDSHKALTVIFILAILAANAFLVVKLLRRAGSRLLQLPQLYVLAALALGDILLALFSLVVLARTAYEDDYFKDSKCSTRQLADVYPSFNAFVFSCGVIVLVVEMWLLRPVASIPSVLKSLVGGFLPYLAGLIVVLPLQFADFDWDKCTYDIDLSDLDSLMHRSRAIAALSLLVLPILAQVAAIALKSCHKIVGGGQVVYHDSSNQPAVVMSSSHNQYSGYPQSLQGGQAYPPQGQPYVQPSAPQLYPTESQPFPSPPQTQVYGQPSAPAAYPPQGQTYVFQHEAPSSGPEVSSSSRVQETPWNVMRQKTTLLIVSVLAFFFYVPMGIFQLAYTLNDDRADLDPIPQMTLTQGFAWLTFLRPVITPLVYARL